MSRAAYRKARRLKTRHARQGHTPWCSCPEMLWWTRRAVRRYLQRLLDEQQLAPVRRVVSRRREGEDDAC